MKAIYNNKNVTLLNDKKSSLSILVLCSDDPQHEYLINKLCCNFDNVHVLVESNKVQIKRLLEKKRYIDFIYRRWHSFRQIVTGRSAYRRNYFRHISGRASMTESVHINSLISPQTFARIKKIAPDVTVVCGTSLVPQKIIDISGFIVNIHGGYLPDYRGNHCIFFAIYNNELEKIASTIHIVTSQLDSGAIIDRVVIPASPRDNDEELYCRVLHYGIDRVVDILLNIRDRSFAELNISPQDVGGYKYYRHRDRTVIHDAVVYIRRLRCARL